MARINIDELFFVDGRIDRMAVRLGTSRPIIESALLRVWSYCYKSLEDTFEAPSINLQTTFDNFAETMLDCGLAERVEEKIRIKGVQDRIQYLLKAAQNGRKSAEIRKQKLGSAQPKAAEGSPKVPSTVPEGSPKVSRRGYATSSSSSSSCSSSYSEVHLETKDKNLEKTAKPDETALVPQKKKTPKPEKETDPRIGQFIGVWIHSYQKRYNVRPVLDGKALGIIRRLVTGCEDFAELLELVQVYCQMEDSWFKKMAHDISTFAESLSKVRIAMAHGMDLEQLEQKQKDDERYSFSKSSSEVAL